ncbi:inositol 1,4,5-trisphosphate receptor-interacting protein [Engraulis encrasicolus]|uniref:inositol 1,4,5-trisphosphate receptor-interacting protein n=1 Tax=Engraulis encrasicolus TaxID=184585 RepID=UPI002FD6038E
MPDGLLRVFVLVAGLLLPKEHTDILEHSDDLTMGMQEREGVLQRERDRLEHELVHHQDQKTDDFPQPLDPNMELNITDQSGHDMQHTVDTASFSAEPEEGKETEEETNRELESADQDISQGEDTLQLKEEQSEPAAQDVSQGEDTLQLKEEEPAVGVIEEEVEEGDHQSSKPEDHDFSQEASPLEEEEDTLESLSEEEDGSSVSLGKEEEEEKEEEMTEQSSKPEDQNVSQRAQQHEEEGDPLDGLSDQLPPQEEVTSSDHQGPVTAEVSTAAIAEEEYDNTVKTIPPDYVVKEQPPHNDLHPEVNELFDNVEAPAVEGNEQPFHHGGKEFKVNAEHEHEHSHDVETQENVVVNDDSGKQKHMTRPSIKSKQQTPSGSDYMWYLYNAYSVISIICLIVGYLRPRASRDQEVAREAPSKQQHALLLCDPKVTNPIPIPAKIHVPDQATLTGFYERYVRVPPNESQRVQEFVEGFADDLLAVMRETSGGGTGAEEGDLEVEDFVEVGSLYESWAAGRPLTCDLWVTLTPRRPYSFQVEPLSTEKRKKGGRKGASSIDLDLLNGYYRRVRVLKGGRGSVTNGCPCSQTGSDNDIMCLLHTNDQREDEKEAVAVDAINGPLCCDDTPYLSRVAVAKWFRSAVRNAWEQTSHKYELELSFQSWESLSVMRVRFRSGKAIHFTLTPVVRIKDTDVCLVSCLGPKKEPDSAPDAQWPVSFARYERSLLRYLGKRLPQNACHLRCLQTLSFLNKKQTELSGLSGLSSHHLKTVLLHLLLQTHQQQQPAAMGGWGSEHFAERLREALDFLKTSLQNRWLGHTLVGNPLVPPEVGLPAHWGRSEPLNVLRPLLMSQGQGQGQGHYHQQQHHYAKMGKHLEEMLKNMPVLIKEYMDQGGKSRVEPSS